MWCWFFCFFRSEDGIRDDLVTGVQTCALPISMARSASDVIKVIYDGEPGSREKISLEALRAIVAEAHDRGVHVVVHIRTEHDSVDALDAGADGLEHSFIPTPGSEQSEAEDLTELLRRSGAYL